LIVITHNANFPVLGDAERVIVVENRDGSLAMRETHEEDRAVIHCGALEVKYVRTDIQNMMEGGIRAFIHRERKYGVDSNRSE
jgi:hypothetical protein